MAIVIYLKADGLQQVSWKRFLRCTLFDERCLSIPLSLKYKYQRKIHKKNMILICIWPLSSHLVDPPPMGTLYMKHALFNFWKEKEEKRVIGVWATKNFIKDKITGRVDQSNWPKTMLFRSCNFLFTYLHFS